MLEFLAYVAVYGLIIGLVLGLIVAHYLDKWRKKLLGIIITMIITGLAFGGGSYFNDKEDEKNWNGGYCQCGGEWRLVSSFDGWSSEKCYIYECPECLHTIKNHNLSR